MLIRQKSIIIFLIRIKKWHQNPRLDVFSMLNTQCRLTHAQSGGGSLLTILQTRGMASALRKNEMSPITKVRKKSKMEEDGLEAEVNMLQDPALRLGRIKHTKQRYGGKAKRLITIEHVWFPAVQTLIGKTGRQRGDTLKPAGKVSLLQSMT